MKKLITIFFIAIANIGFGQGYPIQQNIGSGSTLVRVPPDGGFQASLINRNFVDTTAANATNIKYYPGSQIFTTLDTSLWIRNTQTTRWLRLQTSGQIINGDTINYLVDVNRPPGQLNVYGKFFNGISAYSRLLYTDSIGSGGGGSYTFPYSVVAPGNAIQLENDTTANPANYFYGRNSAGRRGWYPQSGIVGVTPTLQQVLTAGSTLTGNNTIDASGTSFIFDSLSTNSQSSGFITKTGVFNTKSYMLVGSTEALLRTNNTALGKYGLLSASDREAFMQVTGNYGTSEIRIMDNAQVGVAIKPPNGKVFIDSLGYTLSTTRKKIMIRDTATGLVENIDPALIGGSGDIERAVTNITNGEEGGVLYDSAGKVAVKQFAQVDITGIADGDFLKWNAGTTKFIKQTPNWITNVRRSSDSIYATINGVESFVYKDSVGTGGGLDSIDVVAYDSLSTSNVWINSTLKRMGYRVDSFYYHIAITDSVRYIHPDPPPGYDADAQAYFDAITGAGGSLTTPQMDAMNDFVLELKAASIWSGTFDFIHFLVGGSEAAVKFNLVDPVDNDANYRLTFPNSATFASTGVTTNGSNQYINTHDILRNATYADSANYHIAAFNRTTAGVAGFTWGLNDGASSTMYGLCRSTDDKSYVKQPNGSEGNFTDATTGKGFYLVHTRAATVNVEAYKDGVQKIANANNGNGQLMPATYKLLFNAYNNVGTISQYRAGELVLISSGRGFSDTERANYETAVANFITALSL